LVVSINVRLTATPIGWAYNLYGDGDSAYAHLTPSPTTLLSGASVLCTGNQRVAFYLILFWRDGIASVAGSVLPTSSPVAAEPFKGKGPHAANLLLKLRGLRWESSDVPTLSVLQLQTWPYALRLPNVLSVQTLCCLGGVPSIRCQSGISMGDGLLRQHC